MTAAGRRVPRGRRQDRGPWRSRRPGAGAGPAGPGGDGTPSMGPGCLLPPPGGHPVPGARAHGRV